MTKKETFPIYVTLYRQQANQYSKGFDKARIIDVDNLKVLELKDERTQDGTRKRLVIPNTSQAVEKLLVKDKEVQILPTTQYVNKEGKALINEATGKEIGFASRAIITTEKTTKLFPFKLPKVEEKVFTKTEFEVTETLKYLTPEQLVEKYRRGVFESMEDGTTSCTLLEISVGNWCFLVSIIDEQVLRLIPVLSEEQVKFYTDELKDLWINYGKKLSFWEKHPALLVVIIAILTIVTVLFVSWKIAPGVFKATIEAVAQGITTAFFKREGDVICFFPKDYINASISNMSNAPPIFKNVM